MNSTTENQLYNVWMAIAKKTSCNDADRIVEPLKYFIETGRCTGSFVLQFNRLMARQINTIANRLIKVNGMDYEAAINSVTDYMDRI